MRKTLVTFVLIIICFIFQSSVFSYFSFGGIVPNLLIIITASTAMMRGEKAGLFTGFFAGLLADIFFGDFICIYAIIYMYEGYICGFFHRVFFPDNYILPLALISISDFISGFIYYILMFLLRARFDMGHYMTHVIIPELIYTSVVAVFVYPIILFVNTKMDMIVSKGARKFV
ncbi:rod shape-determining protein MreD [Butyrivibrio sp. MC2013]|uniref:rod shape-determining protein MreD n=1 Tax=Butyrivibrio sp. MC2013 TaxID=1280686 RepID=UPI000420BF44|nr:rod shape-determining protein MreD [Butyrivibrio sp. MC2013]